MPAVMAAMFPGGPAELNPLDPKLKDIKLDSAALAKCIHLHISSVLVPLVGMGERGLKPLQKALQALSVALPEASSKWQGMLGQSAVEDVRAAIVGLQALLNPSTEAARVKVEEFPAAKRGRCMC